MRWSNYLHHNSQDEKFGMDCQLVTALNAYRHFTGDTSIKQLDSEYQRLGELAGCCWGSCINIRKVHRKLGLKISKNYKSCLELENDLTAGKFFEISVNHKFYGLHSASIVDYVKKCDCVRVVNLRYVTSLHGWIFWEDLKPFLTTRPHGWLARSFSLTEKKSRC